LFLKQYFYKKFKFKPQIIQILRPEISLKKFEFVILPNHDKLLFQPPKNILWSLGSLVKKSFDERKPDKINDLFYSIDNLNNTDISNFLIIPSRISDYNIKDQREFL
jgi:mitochondrial fission protein ELM1